MSSLSLHEFHAELGAHFTEVNGAEAVANFGDVRAEHAALRNSAAVFDLGFRSRICLVGADRKSYLHGQITNDINRLGAGEGRYAALVTAKGRMQSDLNVWCLADELLLDFEPGLTQAVSERLEKFIVAADVQVVDVAPHYGLLSVHGPRAAEVVAAFGLPVDLPAKPFAFASLNDATLGQLYVMNLPRTGSAGFDLFVPVASLGVVMDKLIAAAKLFGGHPGGWEAMEIARIEAGLPRFGADMDETTLPPEAGLDVNAVSYAKGCYIGQEVLNRIRTIGHVNRRLVGFRLPDGLASLPAKGDRIFSNGKEAGLITSATRSLTLNANIALGYLRREADHPGATLTLNLPGGEIPVAVAGLPFR